jgi:sulfur dioxygenase
MAPRFVDEFSAVPPPRPYLGDYKRNPNKFYYLRSPPIPQSEFSLECEQWRRYNPRLQIKSIDEYVALMASLKLPNPKMMDFAVPSNMKVGLAQRDIAQRGWALDAASAIALLGRPDVAFVDLRETSEREKHGSIPGALHAPYGDLQDNIRAGGILRELARATDKRIVFYCAFGERSAMSVQAAQDAGMVAALHVEGGIDAWKRAGGALAR